MPFTAIAAALLVIFTSSVVAASLPLSLLDANWQLRLISSLIDQAPLALMGLGLFHLEVWLLPGEVAILQRRDLMAQLAVAASIGYLLLMPLQIQAGLRVNQALAVDQGRRISAVERDFQAIRSSIATAGSTDELVKFARLRGGIPFTAADRSLNIEQLRRRLLDNLQLTRSQAIRGIEAPGAPRLMGLIIVSLRNLLCSFVIALAFAAGAQLPSSPFTLLEDWRIRALDVRDWLTRSLSQRAVRREEKQERRVGQQRVAASDALAQQKHPEPSQPQDADPEPWGQSPPLSDLDFFDMIMVDDPVEQPAPSPQAEMPRHQPASKPDSSKGLTGPSAPPSERG